MSQGRRRSFWGWGWEDKFPATDARKHLGKQSQVMLGFSPPRCDDPPRIESISVPSPTIEPPKSLASFCSNDPESRIRHTYGKNFRDVIRGFRGDFSVAPDFVASPSSEADIIAVLDWASDVNVAVIPFGGGTSVVGGVEPEREGGHRGTVSLDLGALDRVLEVEPTSLSARIQAGASGPLLEAQLAEHGLTLRHFPQSFEFSTLGGWIATRAGGHFATLYTHIDDLVQSARMITPRGIWESQRLPGSGAGPSPDRLVLGSEGTLGVITEAWMRVRARPIFRATATTHFTDFGQAVQAVRALAQSGLHPTNCRLLDKREAALNFVTTDGSHVLIVAFESPDHPLQPWMNRALELISDYGGTCPSGPVYKEGDARSGDAGGSGLWKNAFVEAPYMLNIMASLGMVVDTFETACTWDRFEALHGDVIRNVRKAMKELCGAGFISCRFTHVYPDGPAPYFTFIAPGRYGAEAEQWLEIKKVASDTLIEHGATITHHHAIGKLHRPWYERQRPPLFAQALRAAKETLDPDGVLNPGVLLPHTFATSGVRHLP